MPPRSGGELLDHAPHLILDRVLELDPHLPDELALALIAKRSLGPRQPVTQDAEHEVVHDVSLRPGRAAADSTSE